MSVGRSIHLFLLVVFTLLVASEQPSFAYRKLKENKQEKKHRSLVEALSTAGEDVVTRAGSRFMPSEGLGESEEGVGFLESRFGSYLLIMIGISTVMMIILANYAAATKLCIALGSLYLIRSVGFTSFLLIIVFGFVAVFIFNHKSKGDSETPAKGAEPSKP